MKREIRFRAWNSENMFYSHNNSENEAVIQLSWFFDRIRDGEPLMQFTGLKDKNGVDIYIDDLYKDEDEDVFKVMQIECGRFALKMLSNDYIDEFIDWSEVEVIGNIHENSELLKP